MKDEIRKILEGPDWNEEYVKLVAYAQMRLKGKFWQHGREGVSLAQDYLHSAILSVIMEDRKWDKKKHPTFIGFLKSVIDSKIYNSIHSKENKTSSPLDPTDPINESSLYQSSNYASEWEDQKNKFIEQFEQEITSELYKQNDASKTLGIVYDAILTGLKKPKDISKMKDLSKSTVYKAFEKIKNIERKIIDKIINQ